MPIKYLNLLMPHRFDIEALAAEEQVNHISPSLRYWRMTAAVKVPVIWTAINGRADRADHNNLDQFRRLIEVNAPHAPASRMRLVGWTITPEDYRGPGPR